MSNTIKYPESNKLLEIKDFYNNVLEFIENTNKISENEAKNIIYKMFDIDSIKLEDEKIEMCRISREETEKRLSKSSVDMSDLSEPLNPDMFGGSDY